jgi:hypothetical protein
VDDWMLPRGTVDVFAFDGYLAELDPSEKVSSMVAAARAAGVSRTGIAETGAPTNDPDRVAKVRALRSAILAAGKAFDFALYWNSVDKKDHRMDRAVSDAWFGMG